MPRAVASRPSLLNALSTAPVDRPGLFVFLEVVVHALSAGPLTSPLAYVLCVGAVVITLTALVAWAIRAVLKKARSEDLPLVLVGLSHVIGALSCFLPWGKWRNVSGQTPASPETAAETGPGATAGVAPTIAVNTGALMVTQPALPEQRNVVVELPAAEGGNER
ncbi:hypothetical protein ACWC5C_38835 [Streptomyces sp. NPDC001700]